MNPLPDEVSQSSSLVEFLERMRKTFSHDLRSPLGAIVNYSAVLESHPGCNDEGVRDLARRIRNNAQRVGRMLQLLAVATGLASRPQQRQSTDVLELARSVLTDAGSPDGVSMAHGCRESVVDVDAEVLGFALRAYVAFQADASGTPPSGLLLSTNRQGQVLVVQLGLNQAPEHRSLPSEPSIDLTTFLRFNGSPGRVETSMGLSVARDLVASHGGALEVWGRPGSNSGLRLRFNAPS